MHQKPSNAHPILILALAALLVPGVVAAADSSASSSHGHARGRQSHERRVERPREWRGGSAHRGREHGDRRDRDFRHERRRYESRRYDPPPRHAPPVYAPRRHWWAPPHRRHFEVPRFIGPGGYDLYAPYFYGFSYFAPHHHHHRIYYFPVWLDGRWVPTPYAYCEGSFYPQRGGFGGSFGLYLQF